MKKCEKCEQPATIKTVDGNYCHEHLPVGFCKSCGQLVAANEWHELSIQEFGVCGDCVAHKLHHIFSTVNHPSAQMTNTSDDELAFVLDDLEPLYNPATMEILEPSAEGETVPNLGTAIRRIQEQLGFTDDEDEEY